jgi:hypothetical protein
MEDPNPIFVNKVINPIKVIANATRPKSSGNKSLAKTILTTIANN